jgi:hypothetical protein
MALPLRWTVSGISLAIFVLGVAGLLALGAGQASRVALTAATRSGPTGRFTAISSTAETTAS